VGLVPENRKADGLFFNFEGPQNITIVALITCVLAILVKHIGIPVPLAVLILLLLGAALGFVNGALSAYGHIPPFIATLATMSAYRGLAFLVTKGSPIFSVSPALEPMFYGCFLGVPLPFYYVVLFYFIASVFLRNTASGRAIYAVGGNEPAARLSGIHVNRTRLLAFVLAGLTAAIAGVLMTARLDPGSPNYGQGMELAAIAAAVIGGASLTGGYGNIVSTMFGAITVAVVQNGLNLNAVPAAWQEITLGLIIVLAVGLDMWRSDVGRSITQLAPLMKRTDVTGRQPELSSQKGERWKYWLSTRTIYGNPVVTTISPWSKIDAQINCKTSPVCYLRKPNLWMWSSSRNWPKAGMA
jgi:ribose transport system permease protein